ncbi:MAG: acetyl-CoA carboxylase, carboxyltransferase subunit beta [Parvularculales bacterium]
MNWITNVVRPKIRSVFKGSDNSDTLWVKCPECSEMIFQRDLEANLNVCPQCYFHMKLPGKNRLESLFDEGRYESLAVAESPQDPLRFRDTQRYSDRLKQAREKTGEVDAVILGVGSLEQQRVVIAVQDFAFMGGSLGMAAGEAVLTGAQNACELGIPYVVVTASGGARMQEGILSLMQMPRTIAAIQMLRDKGLPYIVVLTDPTSGGVTASYAMLGDVHIAEPGALICFTGPRVIEQTIREQLPDGFQRSEFLKDHGMIDMVVSREELKSTLGRLLRVLISNNHRPSGYETLPSRVSPLS